MKDIKKLIQKIFGCTVAPALEIIELLKRLVLLVKKLLEKPAPTVENKIRIAISSGHGLYVRGAHGFIDEVDQARRVTDRVAEIIRELGHEAVVFHDDVSRNVGDNLRAIVNFHRESGRDRDCFVHFNAFHSPNAHGTEAIFRDATCKPLTVATAEAMATVGFNLRPAQGGATIRGAAKRQDLKVLNSLTDRPSSLLEVCFVTSQRDVDIYRANFEPLCRAIAGALVA